MLEPYQTDEDLVAGLKAGEQMAHLELVKRFGPRMKALIKAMPWAWTMTNEDIREILNDATYKVIENISSFNPTRGEFRTWVFKITLNQGLDRVRRSNTAQRSFEADFESSDEMEDAGKQFPAPPRVETGKGAIVFPLSKGHIIARQAIARLTPIEQQVLKEHMYGLSNPEIAEVLKKSQGSVRAALSRALKHFEEECREICGQRGIDPSELQC